MSHIPFDAAVSWQITLTLLHVGWIGMCLGGVAALGNCLWRHSSSSGRYGWNFGVLLALGLTLPATFAVVRVVASGEDEAPKPTAAPAALASASGVSAQPGDGTVRREDFQFRAVPAKPDIHERNRAADLQPASESSRPVGSVSEPTLRDRCQSAAPTVAIGYLLGVLAMLARLVLAIYGGQGLRRACRPATDETLVALVTGQAGRLGLRCVPAIAWCERVAVPVVVGALRPMILLPAAMIGGLADAQLAAIVTHELAHIRRHDHLLIVVQRLIEAALFFHPATWYLSRRVHHERESCCDDLVLAAGGDRFIYATSLMRVAELRMAQGANPGERRWWHRQVAGLAADGRTPSRLRYRIARLLGATDEPAVRLTRSGSMGGLALVLLAGGLFVLALFSEASEQRTAPGASSEAATAAPSIERAATDVAANPIVEFPPEGDLSLAGQTLKVEELVAALRKAGCDPETTTIGLKLPPADRHKTLLATIDALDKAGWKTVRFIANEHEPAATDENNEQTDAGRFASRIISGLRDRHISGLNEKLLQELDGELREYFGARLNSPLPPARRDELLRSIDDCFARITRTTNGDIFPGFRDWFETLKWELWIAIERAPLSPEEISRRDAQRKWMRNHVNSLPERQGFPRESQLVDLERAWADPLNPFFQQPLTPVEFAEFVGHAHEKDSKLAIAASNVFQSLIQTRIDGLFRRWPTAKSGWHRHNMEWRLTPPQPPDGASFQLHDANVWLENIYADVVRMTFVSGTAPRESDARDAWLARRGQGDLYFDGPKDAFVAVRGARLAMLPWRAARRVELAELQALVAERGSDAVPLIRFFVSGDRDTAPRAGVETRNVVSAAPTLVVQTKEGALRTFRMTTFRDGPMLVSGPEIVAAANQVEVREALLWVTPDGKLSLAGEPIEHADLDARLRKAGFTPTVTTVVIASINETTYRHWIAPVETLHKAGWKRFNFAVAAAQGDEALSDPAAEERTKAGLVMQRLPLAIALDVRDAQSEQPIGDFRAVAGIKTGNAEEQADARAEPVVNWQPQSLRVGRQGALDWPLAKAFGEMVLRIEADGYVPFVWSSIRKAEGPRRIAIRLRKDPQITGTVFQPDGKPAAGATLTIALPYKPAMVDQGHLLAPGDPLPNDPADRWRRPATVVSDPAGRFRLPTEIDAAATLLVLHGSGVAEIPFVEFSKAPAVTLRPWGRVEGQIKWKDLPAQFVPPVVFEIMRGDGSIAERRDVPVDHNARFVVDRVLPGKAQVARPIYLLNSSRAWGTPYIFQGLGTHFDVRAGGSTDVLIGGRGRTVTFRLKGRQIWDGVTLSFGPPHRPPWGFPDFEGTGKALDEFRASPIGPLFFREHLRPKADGTFEIPDMLPGMYEFSVAEQGGEKVFTTTTVTIPPERPGEAPAALDAGEIDLTVPGGAKQAGRAVPAEDHRRRRIRNPMVGLPATGQRLLPSRRHNYLHPFAPSCSTPKQASRSRRFGSCRACRDLTSIFGRRRPGTGRARAKGRMAVSTGPSGAKMSTSDCGSRPRATLPSRHRGSNGATRSL